MYRFEKIKNLNELYHVLAVHIGIPYTNITMKKGDSFYYTCSMIVHSRFGKLENIYCQSPHMLYDYIKSFVHLLNSKKICIDRRKEVYSKFEALNYIYFINKKYVVSENIPYTQSYIVHISYKYGKNSIRHEKFIHSVFIDKNYFLLTETNAETLFSNLIYNDILIFPGSNDKDSDICSTTAIPIKSIIKIRFDPYDDHTDDYEDENEYDDEED